MKLHKNKILFRQAIQFTADKMQIPAIYVEKDYWVTFVLFTIFNNDIGQDMVFKGGKALNEFSEFFYSKNFDVMLLKVANDDVVSFRNNNKWLNHHPVDALFFKDLENVWNELKPIYIGEFKNLVYGDFPGEDSILNTLRKIQERLKTISWTIKVEP